MNTDVNSMYPRTIKPKTPLRFFKLTTAIVDDERWFSMAVHNHEIAEWIRNNDKELWTATLDTSSPRFGTFDIHEKLYLMLELRFG